MNRYNFKVIEEKWQKFWEDKKIFKAKKDNKKQKFYCLEMFLSIRKNSHGSCGYTIGDVLTRYKMQKGFNVLHQWVGIRLVCQLRMQQNQ